MTYINWRQKEKELHRSFFKLMILLFLAFLGLTFLHPCKLWIRLVSKYAPFAFECDFILLKGNAKPSSYDLLVWNSKVLKKKNKIGTLHGMHVQFTYKPQRKVVTWLTWTGKKRTRNAQELSKTYNLIISLFFFPFILLNLWKLRPQLGRK